MKPEKQQELAAKILGQTVTESFGHQIADFLLVSQKAGLSKDESEKMALELFTVALKKVAKKPGKYSHRYHHGGH